MAFTTNQSLLGRIANDCQISWNEFYRTYSQLIKLHGKDYKLTFEECEDLVQDVMKDFFKESSTFIYDKTKGRFRDYLRAMIRNRALNILKKRRNEVDIDSVEGIEAENKLIHLWENEHQYFVIEQCRALLKERLESKTYQAYELCFIQEQPVETVAKLLKLKPNAIYAIKFRIQKIINEALKKDHFRIEI